MYVKIIINRVHYFTLVFIEICHRNNFFYLITDILFLLSFKVPETYATSIERLMIILAENFPTIHQKQHFFSVKSLLWVLITLMPKGEVFSQVLSGFGKNNAQIENENRKYKCTYS